MKPLTLTGLAALLHDGRGRGVPTADVAADIAGAGWAASFAILAGLIATGAANGPAMRAYLQSLYDELAPAERQQAYGLALSEIIAGLDANMAPVPGAPIAALLSAGTIRQSRSSLAAPARLSP